MPLRSGIMVDETPNNPRPVAPNRCYRLSRPTASRSPFGMLLPTMRAGRLGLGELVDNYVDLGDAPGRAKDQPSMADQAVIVEGDLDAVGVVTW